MGKGVAVSVFESPLHGFVRSNGNGTFTCTPTGLREIGATDSIEFLFESRCDRGDSLTVPVVANVTVADFNHSPVLVLKTTPETSVGYRVVKISPIATDPDGEPVTVKLTGFLFSIDMSGVVYQMPLARSTTSHPDFPSPPAPSTTRFTTRSTRV